MNRAREFDQWWESKFGFNAIGNPSYPLLRKIYALGGNPEYAHRLKELFTLVDQIMKEAKGLSKRHRGRMRGDAFEAALKEFGWAVFIGTLGELDEIYEQWKTRPLTFPSQEFLDVVKRGQKIIEDCLWRLYVRRAEQHNERVSKTEREIMDGFKAFPFGDVLYEYVWADMTTGRGNQSKLWETFCATALTEHLREKTSGNQPHLSIGAWLINGKASRWSRQDTKRMGERVRQFKQAHPRWAEHVKQLNHDLEDVENLKVLARRHSP